MTRTAFLAFTSLSLSALSALAGCDCRENTSTYYPALRCGGDDDVSVKHYPCTAETRSCDGPEEGLNGCETRVIDDRWNCGECGVVCPGGDSAACVDGVCILECTGGETDCGLDTCVDLQTDPANCGQCGVVCDAECRQGICLADVLYQSNEPVYWLKCSGDRLVWQDYYTLRSASADNFQPTFLASSMDGIGAHLKGGSLYWMTLSTFFSVPLTGGATTDIEPGPYFPSPIASDDTHLYWLKDDVLRRTPLAGGAIDPFLTDPSPQGFRIGSMAVSSTTLYLGMVEDGQGGNNYLLQAPLSDPAALTPFGPVYGDAFPSIVLDGDDVLTVVPDGTDRNVVRLDPITYEPQVLAVLPPGSKIESLSGDLLLWTEENSLFEADLSVPGSTPIKRAEHPDEISGACVIGDYLYFAGWKDFTIRRVPRF